jgi:uncharacterized phage-associated protein
MSKLKNKNKNAKQNNIQNELSVRITFSQPNKNESDTQMSEVMQQVIEDKQQTC